MITEAQADIDFRRDKIGASESAAIMGEVASREITDVFMVKSGRAIASFTPEEQERLDMGNALESFIANRWALMNDCTIRPSVETLYHPKWPYIIAHPDFYVEDLPFLLEIKNTEFSRGWGEPGTDEVPRPVLIQVQHQMGMFPEEEIRGAYVAVMFAGTRVRSYLVPRCQPLIDQIYAACVDFYENYLKPGIWPDPQTLKGARLRYKTVSQVDKVKTATEEVRETAEQYAYHRAGEAYHKRAKEQSALELIKFMDDATDLICEDGAIATYAADKRGTRSLRVKLEGEYNE